MWHLAIFRSRFIFTVLGILCNSDIGLSITPKPSATGILELALGDCHSMLLKQDGSVWGTGHNSNGQLGFGSTTDKTACVQVVSSGTKAIAAGASHSIVLKQDGSVWTTGLNKYGQLGDGSTHSRTTFEQVIPAEAMAVATGGYHSMVLMQDGGVWATGWNKYGQLGHASISNSTSRSTFMQVMTSGATALAAGDFHSVVLRQDGSVWATGGNSNGQLGDGSRTDRSTFVRVMSSHLRAEAVAAGGDHSLVLMNDGSVWGTGWNRYGQLGYGSSLERIVTAYTEVISVPPEFTGAKAVAAGTRHSMVLKQDGSVWVAGRNYFGQLGDGSKADRRTFMQVLVGGVKAIAAGGLHSMVLKEDGSLWGTGSNKYGQLGSTPERAVVKFVEIDNGAGYGGTVVGP